MNVYPWSVRRGNRRKGSELITHEVKCADKTLTVWPELEPWTSSTTHARMQRSNQLSYEILHQKQFAGVSKRSAETTWLSNQFFNRCYFLHKVDYVYLCRRFGTSLVTVSNNKYNNQQIEGSTISLFLYQLFSQKSTCS